MKKPKSTRQRASRLSSLKRPPLGSPQVIRSGPQTNANALVFFAKDFTAVRPDSYLNEENRASVRHGFLR